jgi:2-dehydropantoate 2-reductase
MRIAIFGMGGVGGFFGARLAQAGEDVICIARGEQLAAIRSSGITVDDGKGNTFVGHPVMVTDDPASVGEVDVVLVAVKTWQVPEAAQKIRPMVGPETLVVPLQNGIEAPAQLAAELGEKPVVGGLCGLISYVVAPGHIRTLNLHGWLEFGELDNRPSERTKRLEQVFRRTENVRVVIPANIHVAVWMKFLLISTWSGIGAITRAPIGIFRSQPETASMVREVLAEGYAVAQAHGIPLAPDAVDQIIASLNGFPAEGTASLQRDIMAGRPSELDAQTGAIVRLGRKYTIATPLNTFIYHSLLPLERRARGQITW